MILFVQIEKLEKHLRTLAPLIDRYHRGEPSFAEDALKWLEEVEKTMSMLRLSEGFEMSALRGRIIRAAVVSTNPEIHVPRSNQRRARNAVAAEALERAETIMRTCLIEAEERLKLFEDKLCEGITVLMLKTSLPEKTSPYEKWLDQVWYQMRQEPSTRPLTLYIAASLSPYDRSFVLDRVLSRATEEDLAHLLPSE